MSRLLVVAAAAASVALLASSDANAQQAGTANAPLPNVLLLVDTSGSMERNIDNSIPVCNPGVATTPNRWGMLLQALTGNVQAGVAGATGYSCYTQPRATGGAYASEFQISGKPPLDVDYELDYHRPVSGNNVGPDTRCVVAPYKLPGGGPAGVGPGSLNEGSGNAEDFPPDAITNIKFTDLTTIYPGGGITVQANDCSFLQANDGQLDLSQDFIRLALMTFDTDPSPKTGTLKPRPAAATVWGAAIDPADPFTGAFSWIRSSNNIAAALPLTSPPSGFIGRTNNAPFLNIPAGPAAGRPTVAGCPQGGTGNAACGLGKTSCAYVYDEVGARHFAAPPWEGRMVLFPDPNAQLGDIELNNSNIQNVLLASRPYGGTPLDGMMDDARDFLWFSQFGPYATSGPYQDNYVQNGCRQQYIVLLTDGAPNIDMRPIDTGNGCQGADCPYNNAYELARSLYKEKGSNKLAVKTFVIGFSVNGTQGYPDANEGFPPALATKTCKGFLTDPAFGGSSGLTPSQEVTKMQQLCFSTPPPCPAKWVTLPGPPATCVPPKASTMDACCQLNRIAYEGSGGAAPWAGDTVIPPYFADSQKDITTAFSAILATITKSATTRTVPAQASNVSIPGLGTPIAATYLASFVPDARKPWSGEIVRSRSYCNGAPPSPTAIGSTTALGDSYAYDLAQQAGAHKRFFFTAKGNAIGGTIDSARTMRPFSGNTDGLQITSYSGAEVAGVDDTLKATANFTDMLQIDDSTCKQSVVIRGGVATPMPSQPKANCGNIIWDFTTAYSNAVTYSGFDYNFRCPTAAVNTGTCSISGNVCTVNLGPAACAASNIPGDTCSPSCTALGAIFRSSPVVVPPPQSFLRDDGYQQFAQGNRARRPSMFVATTDGILHGLMALDTDAAGVAGQGGSAPNAAPYYEFWSFVPPAVLPKLASNFPAGQQILLDGTAAVKDVLWYRDPSTPSATPQTDWHTTLVAGFGAAGGGYYALNVSDADCGGNGPNACLAGTGYTPAAPGVTAPIARNAASSGASTTGGTANGSEPGPHFLWQLTDIEKSGIETSKVTRQAPPGAPAQTFVALFGKQTYTPAIATLQMTTGGGQPVQVGVAILPGGLDGTPVKGGACTRATQGGYGVGFGGGAYDVSPTVGLGSARSQVRQWGKTCGTADPVPGRGVTIVRLDNGEIIRHFGRKGSADVPNQVKPLTIDTPFDSPIIGTPIVYPSAIGVPAQRIYVGDADGTIWRIDVSTPCNINSTSSCDPVNGGAWKGVLFQDTIGNLMPTGGATAAKSQPISIPMVVTPTPTGTVVVNAATGEQENIIASTDENFVVSVEDQRSAPGFPQGKSQLRWFQKLTNGERVTGPMAVFDTSLYFATFRPEVGAVCNGSTKQFLWGLDYLQPAGGLTQPATNGGNCRWVHSASGDPTDITNASCAPGFVSGQEFTTASGQNLIPGVTVQASLGCALEGIPDGFSSGLQSVTPTTYTLVAGVATAGAGVAGSGMAGGQLGVGIKTPRTAATLDAWTLISD